jgi:hypothetical protein
MLHAALSRVTAIMLVLLATVATSRPVAAAPGEIAGSLPTGGGFGLVVWGGGTVETLLAAAAAQGCAVASTWATDANAGLVGHVPGAPALVNAPFRERYPGAIPASTPLLVVCRAASVVTTSTATVQQGGAAQVRVTQATIGSATLLGRTFPLAADGDALVGYVAVGADDAAGPATLTVSFTDRSGVQRNFTLHLTVVPTTWTVDYIVLPPPDPNAPPPPPDEQPRLNALYQRISPRHWQHGWHAPLDHPLSTTGYFGEQRSFNGGPVQGHHGGTDFGAQHGAPIYATNDAVVVLAELTRNRGNLVVLDHGGGVLSSYGHMSQLTVREGDAVERGALLGYVGMTGLATGPHLHWELSVGGVLVDGLRWLDGSQGF